VYGGPWFPSFYALTPFLSRPYDRSSMINHRGAPTKMKRVVIPALLIAALTLSACSAGVKPVDVPPQPVVVELPRPPQPVVPDPPVPSTPPTKLPPVKAEPLITWYARGIGLPLTSDDPAAAGKKVVLLSFDDGPTDEGHTASVLDTLKEQNVRAMFFITGYGARHMDLVERIHREGHVLALHTMSHPNMRFLSAEQMRQEIAPLYELVEKVTGEKPRYFRPPFGAYNQTLLDVLTEYNLELLNWTNGSLDWEGTVNGYKEPNLVVEDVMRQMHHGAVVLFHDTLRHTAEALPEIISRIKADGYEFVVVE